MKIFIVLLLLSLTLQKGVFEHIAETTTTTTTT